jgi:hypothetical protein
MFHTRVSPLKSIEQSIAEFPKNAKKGKIQKFFIDFDL